MIKRNQLWVGMISLCLTLGACQTMSPTGAGRTGQLRFSVAWPGQGFVVHAIPAATRELRIEITGEGLAAPLLRPPTPAPTTPQLELPAVPKMFQL